MEMNKSKEEMMRKKFLMIFVGGLLACCYSALAQRSDGKLVKGRLHTVIYQKNGTTAEGYLQNSFSIGGYPVSYSYHIPSAIDTVMRIKPDNKMMEKSLKYRVHDIDSMSTWLDELPEIKLTWEPKTVDFAFGGKEPAIEPHPSMLLLLYRGKHVKGYVAHHPGYGVKYLFLMGDMPYAKTFLVVGEKLSNRRRKTLLDTFYMYPGMEDYINSLSKDSIKDDPFCILKKLDELLSSMAKEGPETAL